MSLKKVLLSLLKKICNLIFSKRRVENFSYFYLIRNIYKRFLALNGISNITIILKNETYVNDNFDINPLIKIFTNTYNIYNLSYPERLKSIIENGYFTKRSTLFAVVIDNDIKAYSWLHPNYEPDGDIRLLDINNYYSIGPTFVRTEYRNKGFSKILYHAVCEVDKKNNKWPIYTGIEIDNIPMIKARKNSGYILQKIIIRTKNGEPIIL